MVHSILHKARHEHLRLHPFPHLVLRDALPADYYERLARVYPPTELIAGQDELKNNFLYLKSAFEVIEDSSVDPLWREFFSYHCSTDFYHEVLKLWGDIITQIYPDPEATFGKPFDAFTTGVRQPGASENQENRKEDIQLDCQFGVNSPVRAVTSVRGPHTDSKYKLFAALLYFRLPDDDSTGGDLELYRYRDHRAAFSPSERIVYDFVEHTGIRTLEEIDGRFVEKADAIPYTGNTLVMWLNTPYSLHGVSPRALTTHVRRYVNFLGETYTGSRDGFFALRSSKWGRKSFFKRLWR